MTKVFILDALERAGKTLAQAALGVAIPIIVAAHTSDIIDVNWWKQLLGVVSAAVLASLVSLLTSALSYFKTATASASTAVAETAVVKNDPAPVDLPPAVLAPDAPAEASAPVVAVEPTPGEFTSEGAPA